MLCVAIEHFRHFPFINLTDIQLESLPLNIKYQKSLIIRRLSQQVCEFWLPVFWSGVITLNVQYSNPFCVCVRERKFYLYLSYHSDNFTGMKMKMWYEDDRNDRSISIKDSFDDSDVTEVSTSHLIFQWLRASQGFYRVMFSAYCFL